MACRDPSAPVYRPWKLQANEQSGRSRRVKHTGETLEKSLLQKRMVKFTLDFANYYSWNLRDPRNKYKTAYSKKKGKYFSRNRLLLTNRLRATFTSFWWCMCHAISTNEALFHSFWEIFHRVFHNFHILPQVMSRLDYHARYWGNILEVFIKRTFVAIGKKYIHLEWPEHGKISHVSPGW